MKIIETTKAPAALNGIYEKHFISKPARDRVEAAALPKDALVENEVILEAE